jgi:hypothetical protein
VIYLDSSALVKLIVRETETDALRAHLGARRTQQDRESGAPRLRDEEPIERIAMVPGEFGDDGGVCGYRGATFVSAPAARARTVDRSREAESPQTRLDGHLPHAGDAEEEDGRGVVDVVASPGPQLLWIRRHPQEGVGVEEHGGGVVPRMEALKSSRGGVEVLADHHAPSRRRTP